MNRKEFKEMYDRLSNDGRRDLIYCPYGLNPMSIEICWLEIKNDTKLGKQILKVI